MSSDRDMQLVADEHVLIAMRDGTELVASITRPAGDGPFPTILTRTPYDRTGQRANAEQWARAGYAFVRQDVRGRFDSAGEFYPFRDDPADGHDTIEWIARQPWSSGHVGTTGASHVGTVQYLVAPTRPEHLTAAIPEFAPASVFHYWWRQGGAFRLSFNVAWTMSLAQDNLRHFPARMEALDRDRSQAWVTEQEMLRLEIKPLFRQWSAAGFTTIQDVFGNDWFNEFMAHPDAGDFWQAYDFTTQHHEMETPMLHIGGWYDTFGQGTIDGYVGLSEHAASDHARRSQRLIMGPWKHVNWGEDRVGEIEFGSALLSVSPFEVRRRWFDRWLRNTGADLDNEAPVQIFVMGANTWRAEDAWPLPHVQPAPYYLHSDGSLTRDPPASEPPLTFTYDPRDPVTTLGGCEWVNYPCGPFDQRPLDDRRDILRFQSAPLEQDLEVTGQVFVHLFASSSARDTDFTAKLIDVHPNGAAYNLCDGILRGRYRESLGEQTPMEPGEPYEFLIDLWSTSNLFREGHRIRLDISSSNFPRFDANPNTGESPLPAGDPGQRAVTAQNSVHFGRDHPSRVVLPVIPSSRGSA